MTRTITNTKWQGQAALAMGVSCPVIQQRRSEKPGHPLSTPPSAKVSAYSLNSNAAIFAADFGLPQ
jgi:hypothetical protein